MKDFRRATNALSSDEQKRALKRKLVAVQIVGGLITVFGAVAAVAYFADQALLPFLEDRRVALTCLIVAGVAILVEAPVSVSLKQRLSKFGAPRDS